MFCGDANSFNSSPTPGFSSIRSLCRRQPARAYLAGISCRARHRSNSRSCAACSGRSRIRRPNAPDLGARIRATLSSVFLPEPSWSGTSASLVGSSAFAPADGIQHSRASIRELRANYATKERAIDKSRPARSTRSSCSL